MHTTKLRAEIGLTEGEPHDFLRRRKGGSRPGDSALSREWGPLGFTWTGTENGREGSIPAEDEGCPCLPGIPLKELPSVTMVVA